MIAKVAAKYGKDPTRLLDMFWDIHDQNGYVSDENLQKLAKILDCSWLALKDTLSFYHFFHNEPAGKHRIYVDVSAVMEVKGCTRIIQEFEAQLGIKVGEVTPDGMFGLYTTSCIGMSDQGPAALVDMTPVTNLTVEKVGEIIAQLRVGKPIKAQVQNILQKEGQAFGEGTYAIGQCVSLLKQKQPEDVIEHIQNANLRGRGGAGFPTGIKMQTCANQSDPVKYLVCNADEGEPGTFKDRFILTERLDMVIEGMVTSAFAVKAQQGFIYLRGEYRYLYENICARLEELRTQNLLGQSIGGIAGFDFDIRVQLGAGAYVVGEETALLESLEGRRGEPRIRPPFPVEKGYLGKPTLLLNVETYSCISQVFAKGAKWFSSMGTEKSYGTKLLSVSGDVEKPGIYEVEWGISIGEFLDIIGAKDPKIVQVGGASGTMISAQQRSKILAFEDLATGGSMMVFSEKRDPLKIIKNFVNFFVEESCGCCAPCRAGNIILDDTMDTILKGRAAASDLDQLKNWIDTIAKSARCGLGATCGKPLTTGMKAFPDAFYEKVSPTKPDLKPFDVGLKVADYRQVVKDYD